MNRVDSPRKGIFSLKRLSVDRQSKGLKCSSRFITYILCDGNSRELIVHQIPVVFNHLVVAYPYFPSTSGCDLECKVSVLDKALI